MANNTGWENPGMTGAERRSYLIAALLSIGFHLLLLAIQLPSWRTGDGKIEMLSVSLQEIKGAAGQNGAVQTVTPRKEPPNFGKIAESVVKKPVQEKPRPSALPKADAIPNGQSGSGVQTVPDDHPAAQNGPGVPGGASGAPEQLGTGEGMLAGAGKPPFYPKNAMNEGVEGEVNIRISVATDGKVTETRLLKSSGDPRLDKAALNSLLKWQFKPHQRDYYVELGFSFNIKAGITIKFVNAVAGS